MLTTHFRQIVYTPFCPEMLANSDIHTLPQACFQFRSCLWHFLSVKVLHYKVRACVFSLPKFQYSHEKGVILPFDFPRSEKKTRHVLMWCSWTMKCSFCNLVDWMVTLIFPTRTCVVAPSSWSSSRGYSSCMYSVVFSFGFMSMEKGWHRNSKNALKQITVQ
jgi:hypothetical protein